MKGAGGVVLYVGKAKNIKKRVGSYFYKKAHDNKTQALISQIVDIEVTVTANEVEALLLENSLIKKLRPPYNIIFRDDKSYPYVAVSNHKFPRLFLHRGERKTGFKYFGPYPNVKDLRDTIEILQKVFQIRQCEDSYFSSRSRPCLQYQIDKCSAPCVKKISKGDYADDVKSSLLFLKGKVNVVINKLVKDMESAADNMNFEKAAKIRNQIQSLRVMSQRQRVFLDNNKLNVDIVSYSMTKEYICFHVLVVRGGVIVGSRQYLNKLSLDVEISDIFIQFLLQKYSSKVKGSNAFPDNVLVPKNISFDLGIIKYVEQETQGALSIRNVEESIESEWETMARNSAKHAIKSKIQQDESYINKIESLKSALSCKDIRKIICFDVSHLQGTNTIASCIVYGVNGAIKESYRRFKINPRVGGDDYFGIYDAVKRYLSKIIAAQLDLPNIILIDGGQGQVNSAYKAIDELGIDRSVINIVGISKGPERRAGEERIIFDGKCLELNSLLPDSPAFLLLQEIRDEAHRFAISGHRRLRENYQTKSFLEGVSGIGPKKRQDLLKYFGGLRGIMNASVLELAQVPGISNKLAERLFSELHSDIK